MAIRKPAQKQPVDAAAIDRVIEAGSAPPSIPAGTAIGPSAAMPPAEARSGPVKFQMVVPSDLCGLIDGARSLSRTSRRAWLLEAAEERLRREGRL